MADAAATLPDGDVRPGATPLARPVTHAPGSLRILSGEELLASYDPE